MDEHKCEQPGCELKGEACIMDKDDDNPSYFCSEHAIANGHCYICGLFFGGVESFDFGPGYCENCRSEVEEPEPEDEDYDYYGYENP